MYIYMYIYIYSLNNQGKIGESACKLLHTTPPRTALGRFMWIEHENDNMVHALPAPTKVYLAWKSDRTVEINFESSIRWSGYMNGHQTSTISYMCTTTMRTNNSWERVLRLTQQARDKKEPICLTPWGGVVGPQIIGRRLSYVGSSWHRSRQLVVRVVDGGCQIWCSWFQSVSMKNKILSSDSNNLIENFFF